MLVKNANKELVLITQHLKLHSPMATEGFRKFCSLIPLAQTTFSTARTQQNWLAWVSTTNLHLITRTTPFLPLWLVAFWLCAQMRARRLCASTRYCLSVVLLSSFCCSCFTTAAANTLFLHAECVPAILFCCLFRGKELPWRLCKVSWRLAGCTLRFAVNAWRVLSIKWRDRANLQALFLISSLPPILRYRDTNWCL